MRALRLGMRAVDSVASSRDFFVLDEAIAISMSWVSTCSTLSLQPLLFTVNSFHLRSGVWHGCGCWFCARRPRPCTMLDVFGTGAGRLQRWWPRRRVMAYISPILGFRRSTRLILYEAIAAWASCHGKTDICPFHAVFSSRSCLGRTMAFVSYCWEQTSPVACIALRVLKQCAPRFLCRVLRCGIPSCIGRYLGKYHPRLGFDSINRFERPTIVGQKKGERVLKTTVCTCPVLRGVLVPHYAGLLRLDISRVIRPRPYLQIFSLFLFLQSGTIQGCRMFHVASFPRNLA